MIIDILGSNRAPFWKKKSIVNGQKVYILAVISQFTNYEPHIALELGVGPANREFNRISHCNATPRVTGNGDIGALIWAYNQVPEVMKISDIIHVPIIVDAENDCPRRLKVYRRLERLGFYYFPKHKLLCYEKDQ